MEKNMLAGKTILIVEDEPDSLEVATLLLQMSGAKVVSATNGREGLVAAKVYKPTFIISDLSMPEMSGWQMLHELKRNPATQNIPVVALTAHAMEGDRHRAIEAGFHNYLSKPLTPETFIENLLRVVMDTPGLASVVEK